MDGWLTGDDGSDLDLSSVDDHGHKCNTMPQLCRARGSAAGVGEQAKTLGRP